MPSLLKSAFIALLERMPGGIPCHHYGNRAHFHLGFNTAATIGRNFNSCSGFRLGGSHGVSLCSNAVIASGIECRKESCLRSLGSRVNGTITTRSCYSTTALASSPIPDNNSNNTNLEAKFLNVLKEELSHCSWEESSSTASAHQKYLSILKKIATSSQFHKKSLRFSPGGRKQLASLLHCASQKELSSVLKKLRYYMHSSGKPIQKQHRLLVLEYLRKLSLTEGAHNSVTPKKMSQLRKMTGLSQQQLVMLLARLGDAPGNITEHVKRQIRDWVSEHGFPSNSRERRELQKLTGLSREQLYAQLRILSHRPVTSEQRDFIKSWLQEHGHRQPTNHEMMVLQKETGLSSLQMYTLIRTLRAAAVPMNRDAQKLIKDFVEHEQQDSGTSSTKIDHIQQQTGLTRYQITRHMDYLRNTKKQKKVTQKDKEIIREWLQEHNNRRPNSQEREHLQRLTGLNKFQLRSQISSLLDASQPLTEEKKQHISLWLERNDYREPTREERSQLKEQSQLSSRQISNLVRRFRSRNFGGIRSIPVDFRNRVLQILKENNYENLDAAQRKQLLEYHAEGSAPITGQQLTALVFSLKMKRKRRMEGESMECEKNL